MILFKQQQSTVECLVSQFFSITINNSRWRQRCISRNIFLQFHAENWKYNYFVQI